MPVHGVCAWGDTSTAADVVGVSSPTVPASSLSLLAGRLSSASELHPPPLEVGRRP